MTSELQSVFQLGKEITPGIAVPASLKFIGLEHAADTRLIITPPGYDSLAGGVSRFVQGHETSRFITPERSLTYEELPILLSSVIGDVPLEPLPGPPAAHRIFSLAGVPFGPAFYTIETGVPGAVYRSRYAFIKALTIAMASPVVEWRYMSEWLAQDYVPVIGTVASAHINQQDILAPLTKLWVFDPAASPLPIVNTLVSFRLLLQSGLSEIFIANGSQSYSAVMRLAPAVTLSLTLESNDWLAAERAKRDTFSNPPEREFRIQATGSNISPGVPNSATIDLVGTWLSLSAPRADEFSDLVVDAEIDARFHPTAGIRLEIDVVNSRVAVP